MKQGKNKILKSVLCLSTVSTLLLGPQMISKSYAKETYSQVLGYENESASLSLTQIARYDSKMTDADGGVTEIVDYNTVTGWAYVVNGKSGKLTAIALKDLQKSEKMDLLDGNDIDIRSLVENDSFVYGDMTSVSVSHDGKTLAVAIQGENTNDQGRVALFECQKDGTLTLKNTVTVGVQPDMVTFTNDDQQVLTANEGEPRDGYGADIIDPKGSISVIDVNTQQVTTVDFSEFDAKRDELVEKGIVLKKNTTPSVDLEPEYIAVSDTKAYITLQEANAIAIMDLKTLKIENIYSAGLEDYSQIAVDIDKKDEKYAAKTYSSLRGIRMPDAISVYTVDGVDYLVTANEGDSREWNDYLNEKEINFGKGKTSPTGQITAENSGLTGKVIFFDTDDYDGLNKNNDYLFGGRSATLFKVTNQSLEEVYTTGNDFEAKTAQYLPEYFNCSNDDKTVDDRSGKKGPEAESVTIGTIDNQTYAFVGLERVGGIMVYDITNPEKTTFVNYINSRDFSADIAGDDSPEGMHFISAEESQTKQAQLVVAYEVSGTVGVYDLTKNKTTEVKPEEPDTEKPDTEKPDTEQPDTEKPDTQLPTTDDNQTPSIDSTGTDNQNSTQQQTQNKPSSLVKTDDPTSLYALVTVMVVSGTCAVIFMKKKKTTK